MTASIITAPPLDDESRRVFAGMAKLIEGYLANASDDQRNQIVQLTCLLRHASSYTAALTAYIAEQTAAWDSAHREADYYASETGRLRDENTGLLARIEELVAEVAALKPQT